MTEFFQLNRRLWTIALLTLIAVCQIPQCIAQVQPLTVDGFVKSMPECNVSKTNSNCKLVIDRANPLVPPTIQMYSNKVFVVVIKHPLPYERYFLDYGTSAATVSPDVAANIVTGLISPLGHLVTSITLNFQLDLEVKEKNGLYTPAHPPCETAEGASNTPPDDLGSLVTSFQDCLGELTRDAIPIYRQLEPFVAPDSLVALGEARQPAMDLKTIASQIAAFSAKETAASGAATFLSGQAKYKNNSSYATSLTQLANLQKLLDGIATDLLGYGGRLRDLEAFRNGQEDCAVYLDEVGVAGKCIAIGSRRDDSTAYKGMVSRTITYALDTLNLVANSQEAAPDPSKKKSLGNMVLNFADQRNAITSFRWEASAGVFFSTLPVRSFNVAPVFTNLVVTDNVVQEQTTHPTVVPFAAANYRITDDLPGFRWKSNLYWTVAAGVNPNTVTADFATGLSWSWRAFMLSALCHFGHETRLTGGFTPGEHLGATFNAKLPTENHWTESFALGISVRVPSLTGR